MASWHLQLSVTACSWVGFPLLQVWCGSEPRGLQECRLCFGIWHGSICMQTGCHAGVLRGWGQQQVHQHMLQYPQYAQWFLHLGMVGLGSGSGEVLGARNFAAYFVHALSVGCCWASLERDVSPLPHVSRVCVHACIELSRVGPPRPVAGIPGGIGDHVLGAVVQGSPNDQHARLFGEPFSRKKTLSAPDFF